MRHQMARAPSAFSSNCGASYAGHRWWAVTLPVPGLRATEYAAVVDAPRFIGAELDHAAVARRLSRPRSGACSG